MRKTFCLFILATILLICVSSAGESTLPPPASFNADVTAPSFTMTAIGNQTLTSLNYGAGKNILMIYGRISCGNTRAFLSDIQEGMDELAANGITVLVCLLDNPSDSEMNTFANTYPGIVCAKVSNSSPESGMWTGLNAVGYESNSVAFPVVFLRSSNAKLRYYSTGYVSQPLRIVSAAIVMSGGDLPEIPTSGSCGENITWSLTNSGILTISGTGYMNDYQYNGAPWYEIRDEINKVVVTNGVMSIGEYAFFECSSLYSVSLPTTLERINENAFMYCYSLPSLTIPEGVRQIGKSIIYRNYSLTEINLPASLISIGGSFAGECPNLRKITVASGNTSYKVVKNVLYTYNMDKLICHPAGLSDTTFNIPSGVKILDVYAFDSNTHLINVVIPNTVTRIDSCAFSDCSNLESISLPDSVNYLGIYAFCDCPSLKTVKLSNNIMSIDQQAFSRCYQLKKISLPSNLTYIGNFVFLGSTNLNKVYIPNSVMTIKDNAFEDCPNVTIYCYTGSYAQSYATDNNIDIILLDAKLGEPDFVLPPSLTKIEEYAFDGIAAEIVYIPNTCTSIGSYAFQNSAIMQIRIPARCTIATNAFNGCDNVVIFGTAGSSAEAFCKTHDNCTFVVE